jgi:hypothetical protein
VREAIYGELSAARRALLHGHVAAALERLHADAADLEALGWGRAAGRARALVGQG